MFLRSIEVHHFRNLEGKIVWGSGLNILHGNNCEGRSNWLEAIYLLAHAKSFRTRQLTEALRFGASLASVRGTVARGNAIERELQVDIQASSKKTSVNGKREPLARYAAQLHAVSFTADELEVIRGGPEARRGFVDRGAVSLHPGYVQTLADYVKGADCRRSNPAQLLHAGTTPQYQPGVGNGLQQAGHARRPDPPGVHGDRHFKCRLSLQSFSGRFNLRNDRSHDRGRRQRHNR